VVAVVAVRKVAPLRLSGLAALVFSIPLWVLPFLPPWPVVVAALFAAMFFTPLINGPSFAVITARTPEQLRAKVMTAVISVNTVAGLRRRRLHVQGDGVRCDCPAAPRRRRSA